MACPPPSSRQRIPGRPTKSGDRFKLRGLLPRLYSRLLIALIVVLSLIGNAHDGTPDANGALPDNAIVLLGLLFVAAYAFGYFSLVSSGFLATWLSNDWLRWFGNMSYSFYLLHGLLLNVLKTALEFAGLPASLPAVAVIALFVLAFGIILSMYGGGFATVPAYLADMFGTQFVGAIHGRLLTAWSTAGIIGPVVVNYLREFQLAAGVPRDKLYDSTMYVLCAMLVAGLICNFLIKPVNSKWYMSEAEVAKLQAASAKSAAAIQHGSFGIGKGGLDLRAALFWLFVGVPLGWGVWQTLLSAAKIF